jgi:hypothetical protein
MRFSTDSSRTAFGYRPRGAKRSFAAKEKMKTAFDIELLNLNHDERMNRLGKQCVNLNCSNMTCALGIE